MSGREKAACCKLSSYSSKALMPRVRYFSLLVLREPGHRELSHILIEPGASWCLYPAALLPQEHQHHNLTPPYVGICGAQGPIKFHRAEGPEKKWGALGDRNHFYFLIYLIYLI